MIKIAKEEDVKSLVQISHVKRKKYEKKQPLFFKEAHNSNKKQEEFFSSLLNNKNIIILVFENIESILGFVIGSLRVPPAVYSSSLTLYIDDFCIAESNWNDVGEKLLDGIVSIAKERKAVQIVVVSTNH